MAVVSLFLNKWHPKQDPVNPKKAVFAVAIRVTHQKQKKYYGTGINLAEEEFARVVHGQDLKKKSIRKTEAERLMYLRLQSYVTKASEAVAKLQTFTFNQFEDMYIKNRGAVDSVSAALKEYAEELRTEGRIGTAVSFEAANKSLDNFKEAGGYKDFRFADITKVLLAKYQTWMKDQGRSDTTVGIYLRCLRTVFNRANIDKSLYPFGKDNSKFTIPKGSNTKKALTLEEIGKIMYAEIEKGGNAEMSRDYWIFIYLCNGLNVKDLCLLKWKNISKDGRILSFSRAKTQRTKNDSTEIRVSLKPQANEIIKRWGQRSLSPEGYIFDHLHRGMTAEEQYKTIQKLTQLINKNMRKIAAQVGITKPVRTYEARHSFSTVLKRSGASIEFIQEALGHSDKSTTMSYLDSFESEVIHEKTDALLPKLKTAN